MLYEWIAEKLQYHIEAIVFITDFELASINALKRVFNPPQCRWFIIRIFKIISFKSLIIYYSCQWHFGYNVRKIALQHGLKPYIDSKVMNHIQKTMRLINSCPILPERVLPKFYDHIQTEGLSYFPSFHII